MYVYYYTFYSFYHLLSPKKNENCISDNDSGKKLVRVRVVNGDIKKNIV